MSREPIVRRRWNHRKARAICAPLMMMALPCFVQAGKFASIDLNRSFQFTNGPVPDSVHLSVPLQDPDISISAMISGYPATGTAQVSYGVAKVSGYGGFTGGQFGGAFASTQIAGYQDLVTINVPGVASGTLVSVLAGFDIPGALIATGDCGISCGGFWDGQLSLGSGFEVSGGVTPAGPTGSQLGAYSHAFLVLTGTPTALDVQLTGTAAGAHNGYGFPTYCPCGTGTDSLANSMYWTGISSVTLNGQQVPFTVTSASGTDWSQSFVPAASSVPEPGTRALTAAVLGVAWVTWRRKRSA